MFIVPGLTAEGGCATQTTVNLGTRQDEFSRPVGTWSGLVDRVRALRARLLAGRPLRDARITFPPLTSKPLVREAVPIAG